MRCYCPRDAQQDAPGERLRFDVRPGDYRSMQIRCGQCIGCRLAVSRGWAIRCIHEAQMHEYSCFVTLTYDDAHCPVDGSLCYSDFQCFMRRLRKYFDPSRQRIRFYMCGEYGELNARPHFHACLFNCRFSDRVLFKQLDSGCDLYTSEALSSLWPFGFSSIGDVTFESAAYIARYVVKKINGLRADEHYKRVDEFGEFYWLRPEFTRMSLKPGIGFKWFEKYQRDVYPLDRVVLRGRVMSPPKYYDKLLEEIDGFELDEIKFERTKKALAYASDNSPQRLIAQEVVTKARLAFKLRSL